MTASKLNPPFRADHVGSLLRPPDCCGHVTARQPMIPKLEATGIQSITDGEYLRFMLHLDFLELRDLR